MQGLVDPKMQKFSRLRVQLGVAGPDGAQTHSTEVTAFAGKPSANYSKEGHDFTPLNFSFDCFRNVCEISDCETPRAPYSRKSATLSASNGNPSMRTALAASPRHCCRCTPRLFQFSLSSSYPRHSYFSTGVAGSGLLCISGAASQSGCRFLQKLRGCNGFHRKRSNGARVGNSTSSSNARHSVEVSSGRVGRTNGACRTMFIFRSDCSRPSVWPP